MCSHYQAFKDRAKFEKEFHVRLPPYEGVHDVWPTYAALFVRRPLEADAGDEAVPEREALPTLTPIDFDSINLMGPAPGSKLHSSASCAANRAPAKRHGDARDAW